MSELLRKFAGQHLLKTIFCDAGGKELISAVEKLSQFRNGEKNDFSSIIGFYQTENHLDVD